jgi:GNAT superfamily N-acetyltransferase
MTATVRPMCDADLDAVFAIQAVGYLPDLHESRAAVASRLRLFPAGCWVAATGGAPVGYLISHPWIRGDVPVLDRPLASLPARGDCYYIHDVCIRDEARHGGIARALVSKACDAGHRLGLSVFCLTAVQGSAPVWARMGFAIEREISTALRRHLDTYGPDACYMRREEA